jgi:hypothetical protein
MAGVSRRFVPGLVMVGFMFLPWALYGGNPHGFLQKFVCVASFVAAFVAVVIAIRLNRPRRQ